MYSKFEGLKKMFKNTESELLLSNESGIELLEFFREQLEHNKRMEELQQKIFSTGVIPKEYLFMKPKVYKNIFLEEIEDNIIGVKVMDFETIQDACKNCEFSNEGLVCRNRHNPTFMSGTSWGKCSKNECPLIEREVIGTLYMDGDKVGDITSIKYGGDIHVRTINRKVKR